MEEPTLSPLYDITIIDSPSRENPNQRQYTVSFKHGLKSHQLFVFVCTVIIILVIMANLITIMLACALYDHCVN